MTARRPVRDPDVKTDDLAGARTLRAGNRKESNERNDG